MFTPYYKDVFDCRLIEDDCSSNLCLTQARLHEHHHHHVDVDFKPNDSHHGDQDDQHVDQNDDKKDPLLIEDDVDDDDNNDNHHAIDLQNDDDTCHNDDDDNGDNHVHVRDDNEYSGDDHHQDLAVNALTLQPPSSLPNKSYINHFYPKT